MSYIDLGRDRNSLPVINSARRIRELETELQAYRLRDSERIQPSPPSILKYDGSQTRREIREMQDQIKTFREELKKKDSLIQHLVSLDSAPKTPKVSDTYRLDSIYLNERSVVDSTKSDLAALQVKYERSQDQIKQMSAELEAKDIKIRELQLIIEGGRETEARLSDLVSSLKDKLAEYESRADSYETVANRGEYTIVSLQKELREANEKIAEQESRIGRLLQEKDGFETRVVGEGRRLRDLLAQLSSLLYTEELVDCSDSSIDVVIRKVTEVMQDNAMLKGKIQTMNEHLGETQLETKASRETIMRLVSEVSREQKTATRYTSEIENLRVERDNAVAKAADIEREISLMKDRLEASHRAMEAAKNEMALRDNRYSSLEREMQEKLIHTRTSGTQFDLFREQLANLLSVAFSDVVPTEECIKDCVKRISEDKRTLDLRVEEYEARIKQLTEQLEKELSLHRDMAERAKRFEAASQDIAERLRIAEGELASGDVLRDGFRFDKEKYLRGLQKLGEIMKMDRISLDLGLDLTMDALVARAEQLMKLEADALADKSTHVYNLQRKVKALKEQLESKELHIDLLRKKMTSLEERCHGRIDIEKQREVESLRVTKLEKLVEKYKLQLQDSRQEVQNLKAQLLGSSDLKVCTLEQRKDIEELARQVQELEEIRRRQSEKISELKGTLENSEVTKHERTLAGENAVQALSSELRTTKNALENIKHREKQLVDFRTVVARMLGLDINTLAVPDYEIITRLEKLIEAHQTTAFTTMNLEEALADVSDGTDVRRTLEIVDPVVYRSRDRNRRRSNRLRTRARSASPMKREPRAY